MNGYLTRLIARSNGSESVVRPDLTPACAVRGEVELGAAALGNAMREEESSELRELAEPARSLATVPASPSSGALPAVDRSAAAAPLGRKSRAKGELPRAQRAVSAAEGPNAEPASLASPVLAADDAFAQPDRAEPWLAPTVPGVPLDLSPDERARMQVDATRAPSLRRDAARVTSRPPAARRSERNEVEPSAILRVAIGRIEVRASLPRTAQAPAEGSRAAQSARRFSVAPKLTLEAYLNRRELRR